MKKIIFILAGLSLMSTSAFAKGNAAAGKKKAASCIACHGAKGKSTIPMYPHLAGQQAQYTVKQLKDFKSGKRKDPVMGPMAKPLKPQDMEDLAAYYAKMK